MAFCFTRCYPPDAMPLHVSPHEVERRRRRREAVIRRRRLRLISLFALVFLSIGAFASLSLARKASVQVPADELLVNDGANNPVEASGESRPFFASLQGQNLVLPVAARHATVIAYQAAADERAVPLEPVGSQVNGGVVARSISRVFSPDSSVRYYVLKGAGRVVAPTGAVAIGAPAGTVITSPVSGEITGVKQYRLLGKYDDVQVDIRPAKMSGVTVSLLFVNDPAVTIGQTVVAGSTQIGTVRKVPGDLGAKVAELTHDSGSHVYIQVTQDPTE